MRTKILVPIIAVLVAATAFAGEEKGKKGEGRKGKGMRGKRPPMVEVKGSIESVKEVEKEGRRGGKRTVYEAKIDGKTVILGSVEAWKKAGVTPKKGMKIEGKGFQRPGTDVIMLRKIKADGKEIELRGWRGRRGGKGGRKGKGGKGHGGGHPEDCNGKCCAEKDKK